MAERMPTLKALLASSALSPTSGPAAFVFLAKMYAW